MAMLAKEAETFSLQFIEKVRKETKGWKRFRIYPDQVHSSIPGEFCVRIKVKTDKHLSFTEQRKTDHFKKILNLFEDAVKKIQPYLYVSCRKQGVNLCFMMRVSEAQKATSLNHLAQN